MKKETPVLSKCSSFTIGYVKALNEANGFCFFSESTMRFFNCIVSGKVFDNRCFVTSERDKGVYIDGKRVAAWDGKRRYTVRQFDPYTGDIYTVSEYGQFATLKGALNYAARYRG